MNKYLFGCFCLLITFFSLGCSNALFGPGTTEFKISIDEYFFIANTSKDNIVLFHRDEYKINREFVPRKIVRANWNEDYIILERENANQKELKYWIVDKKGISIVGANLDLDRYNELKDKLKIEVDLIKISKLRNVMS
ncbi:DUF3997 domain-containing protein [Halalkalibacter akibai]|uniref:DUF3997 domain-containing protein n=1 Tax=Halalkalibacter akibai (strain ATCC 43226 / DSM 21942 / CIP 109018 / JCM 9157 / 1139) TaxID=1236973 RepID=W4QZK5_HALA3|nr:DUF3997 domain-containing protein [Halalkalibacter akibai]GAE37560.1 hypothetical protein JCM9157_4871 [Halalkalibacter akibai JCM 9157]